MALKYLTEGTFTFADGASISCGVDAAAGLTRVATYSLLIEPGQHSTKISTQLGDRWRIEATQASERVTECAIKKSGEHLRREE